MTIYGVDVASYQGAVDWSAVYKTGIRFGFSKVTENVGYVNPYWAHNRKGMLALGSDFLPGAYHFLHGGNGAAQAKHFLDAAGDVSGFAVALDVEANGADAATAKAWVTEFKKRTGGHPVIGYFPTWYWSAHGKPDLSFFDTIWQSRYVSGAGSPSGLYGHVPASWWTTFGGEPISILQFSSSATVAGVSGHVDVNAYRGTLDQLRALALGIKEDDMEPTTSVTVPDYWKGKNFSHDSYPAAFLWAGSLSETRTYGKAILTKLEALQATNAELVKTVAALAANPAAIDVDALVARIEGAIESIEIKLDVPDAEPTGTETS